jgi:hypothetical protein
LRERLVALKDGRERLAEVPPDLRRDLAEGRDDAILARSDFQVGPHGGAGLRLDQPGADSVLVPGPADGAADHGLRVLPQRDLAPQRLVQARVVGLLHAPKGLGHARPGEHVGVPGLLDTDRERRQEGLVGDGLAGLVVEVRDEDPVPLREGQHGGSPAQEVAVRRPDRQRHEQRDQASTDEQPSPAARRSPVLFLLLPFEPRPTGGPPPVEIGGVGIDGGALGVTVPAHGQALGALPALSRTDGPAQVRSNLLPAAQPPVGRTR